MFVWPIIEHYSGQILVCLEQESPVRPKKVWQPLAKYDTRKQQVSSWILNLILHLQIPSLTELELEAVEIGRGEESPSEKKIFLKRKLSQSIYLPVLSDFHPSFFLTILFRSGLKWGSWFWHKRKASWRERCRWAASYWSRTRNTSSVHSFHIGEHLCLLLHFKSSCDPQVLLCLVVCLAAILFCLQSRYDGDYLGGAHTFTYNVHNTHENYFETWSMYTIIGQDLDNK